MLNVVIRIGQEYTTSVADVEPATLPLDTGVLSVIMSQIKEALKN